MLDILAKLRDDRILADGSKDKTRANFDADRAKLSLQQLELLHSLEVILVTNSKIALVRDHHEGEVQGESRRLELLLSVANIRG